MWLRREPHPVRAVLFWSARFQLISSVVQFPHLPYHHHRPGSPPATSPSGAHPLLPRSTSGTTTLHQPLCQKTSHPVPFQEPRQAVQHIAQLNLALFIWRLREVPCTSQTPSRQSTAPIQHPALEQHPGLLLRPTDISMRVRRHLCLVPLPLPQALPGTPEDGPWGSSSTIATWSSFRL